MTILMNNTCLESSIVQVLGDIFLYCIEYFRLLEYIVYLLFTIINFRIFLYCHLLEVNHTCRNHNHKQRLWSKHVWKNKTWTNLEEQIPLLTFFH